MSLDSPQDSQPSHAHAHKVCKTSSVVESGHLDAASKTHRPHTGDLLFPRGAALVLFLFASNNHTPVSLCSLPYLCEYNTYQTTKLTLFSLFCYISVTEPNIPFSLKKKKKLASFNNPRGLFDITYCWYFHSQHTGDSSKHLDKNIFRLLEMKNVFP